MTITVKKINPPIKDNSKEPIILSDKTFEERKDKVLNIMKKYSFSSLIVYADKEHGSNFEYLTGFIPRFEEALQILNQDGTSFLILGNENANKVEFARIKSRGIKCPLFSLPNQPNNLSKNLTDYLNLASIDDSKKIGLVDWKLLSTEFTDFHSKFAVPTFIVDSIKEIIGTKPIYNATSLYIHPQEGVRTTNNAEEILHYEYGASLASDAVLEGIENLVECKTELEIGNFLNKDGQYPSVVTISSFGDRFLGANLYPMKKELQTGDKVALTVGYKGGLTSRSGYAVFDRNTLEDTAPGYFKEVVEPYFVAYKEWLNSLKIGVSGAEFYEKFEMIYPKKKFGWSLCPGHLVADEEWLSSPFYEDSTDLIKSGNIFQIDFIPSQTGFNGISAESTVAVASTKLQEEIQKNHPSLWNRIVHRRHYIKESLGLELSSELLPLCSTLAHYTPFMLNKECGIFYK